MISLSPNSAEQGFLSLSLLIYRVSGAECLAAADIMKSFNVEKDNMRMARSYSTLFQQHVEVCSKDTAEYKLKPAAKTAEAEALDMARNPLICIPLDQRAACKNPSWLSRSEPLLHKTIRRSGGSPGEAKWVTSAHLGSQPKIQPEEELIIFMDNGILSVSLKNLLRRFYSTHPCQLMLGAAYITLIEIERTYMWQFLQTRY